MDEAIDSETKRRAPADPGFRLGAVLAGGWLLSWMLVPVSGSPWLAGLPALTWAHIGLGVLAVTFNVIAIFVDRRR